MFKKILVPVDIDYPEMAAAVFYKAAAIAKMSGAEMQLISVMPGFGTPLVASFIPENVRKKAADQFKESLDEFIKAHCSEPVAHTVRVGKNWEEIIKAAEKWGADLIVVYHNHRHDINEAFSRSCSQRVAENAKCSVLRLRNLQI